MEWFLGFLILVGFAVDIVLYILDRGGFIRVSTSLENLAGDVKNLGEKVGELVGRVEAIEGEQKTLAKNAAYDNSTLAGSMEQIENRIAQLTENHETLDKEVSELFHMRADIEHPVLEPARNKGGRPKKVSNL